MLALQRGWFVSVALALAACADDPHALGYDDDNIEAQLPPVPPLAPVQHANVDTGTPDASAPLMLPEGAPDSGLPCDVQAVLATHCQRCHDGGANSDIPLLTRDDLLSPSTVDSSANVMTRVLARIAARDEPMPPTSEGAPLSDEDRAVLELWVMLQLPAENCTSSATP